MKKIVLVLMVVASFVWTSHVFAQVRHGCDNCQRTIVSHQYLGYKCDTGCPYVESAQHRCDSAPAPQSYVSAAVSEESEEVQESRDNNVQDGQTIRYKGKKATYVKSYLKGCCSKIRVYRIMKDDGCELFVSVKFPIEKPVIQERFAAFRSRSTGSFVPRIITHPTGCLDGRGENGPSAPKIMTHMADERCSDDNNFHRDPSDPAGNFRCWHLQMWVAENCSKRSLSIVQAHSTDTQSQGRRENRGRILGAIIGGPVTAMLMPRPRFESNQFVQVVNGFRGGRNPGLPNNPNPPVTPPIGRPINPNPPPITQIIGGPRNPNPPQYFNGVYR